MINSANNIESCPLQEQVIHRIIRQYWKFNYNSAFQRFWRTNTSIYLTLVVVLSMITLKVSEMQWNVASRANCNRALRSYLLSRWSRLNDAESTTLYKLPMAQFLITKDGLFYTNSNTCIHTLTLRHSTYSSIKVMLFINDRFDLGAAILIVVCIYYVK